MIKLIITITIYISCMQLPRLYTPSTIIITSAIIAFESTNDATETIHMERATSEIVEGERRVAN